MQNERLKKLEKRLEILLLKNETLGKYKTIWEKDLDLYYKKIWDERLFRQYAPLKTRWEIVKDHDEIRHILEENYSSKGRGAEYEEGLPSGTVISSSLRPINMQKDLFKLTYLNNVDEEEFRQNELRSKEALYAGSFFHKCLELWLISPLPKEKRNIDDIIELALNDEEIKIKVPNIKDREVKYKLFAKETLPKFIQEIICRYDLVGSEIYLNTGKLQGSVDVLLKRNGKFVLGDFKTTSALNHKTQKRKFSSYSTLGDYIYQLAVYTDMLINQGYIPECELNNIEYRIWQFHLVSHEYKEFILPNEDVTSKIKECKEILNWYWEMKK